VSADLASFQSLVWREGQRWYRDLPWRNISDPWHVLVSEVMLQQTQVARVLNHWPRWIAAFPTPEALAAASTADTLAFWQGLGYHRRALALKRAAEMIERDYAGIVPQTYESLLTLPGVGPATAAGVCVFARNEAQIYLETNVRAVFLHHFFAGCDQVPDRELIPLIETSCDRQNPRSWYYALLDYGNYLKQILPNPSRASAHHTRQSRFEGSVRQKRAWLLRDLLAMGDSTIGALLDRLNAAEQTAGRRSVDEEELRAILKALDAEGFISGEQGFWRIAGSSKEGRT
jgi:A/G-specific adenine glycosylase